MAQPPGSHPYFQFPGVEPLRYAAGWSGGAGGVLPTAITRVRAGAESRGLSGLGIDQINESYIGSSAALHETMPYPAFSRTMRHAGSRLMNGPGAGPIDELSGIWDGLSDNEKTLALVAAAGGALWWLSRRRRRNPANPRGRYVVRSSSRGVRGSIRFTTKKAAHAYAESLRAGGKTARVSRA
jgi:hypothetical protein